MPIQGTSEIIILMNLGTMVKQREGKICCRQKIVHDIVIAPICRMSLPETSNRLATGGDRNWVDHGAPRQQL